MSESLRRNNVLLTIHSRDPYGTLNRIVIIQCFGLQLILIQSMDCMNLVQNKRRHSGELEQWHSQPKRQCNGLGGCGQVMDTPMDTWDAPNHSPQNGHGANVPGMVLNAPGRSAGQHCPRCMAGEPGHINHIMRY